MIRILRAGTEAHEGEVTLPSGERFAWRETLVLRLETLPGARAWAAEALAAADRDTWVLFTSVGAVRFLTGPSAEPPAPDALLERLRQHPIAAIGEVTARELRERGFAPDLVANTHSGNGMADAVLGAGARKALWPANAAARPTLRDRLVAAGVPCTFIPLFEETRDDGAIAAIVQALGAPSPGSFPEALGCSSPEVAMALLEGIRKQGKDPVATLRTALVGAIGPTTAKVLTAAGVADLTVPTTPSVDALRESLAQALVLRGRST